jgi:hypothetical protein
MPCAQRLGRIGAIGAPEKLREPARIAEAVLGGNPGQRLRSLGAQHLRPRRLQPDALQCRHGRCAAEAAKRQLQRANAAPRGMLDERQFTAREWAPLDQRRFRMEPESYLTQYCIANVGAVLAGRIADSCATEFRQRSPGVVDAVWITLFERGAGRVVLPGSDEPAIGNVAAGWTWDGAPGSSGASSDGASRLFLWLPARLLRQRLEVLLDGQRVESIAFQPVFDATRGAGGTVRRMAASLFAELEHSDTLLTNEVAIRSFEEHLALCLLLGLPHNYSERLYRQKAPAAPANVKRAEEFMRANACVPLTIEAIAKRPASTAPTLAMQYCVR